MSEHVYCVAIAFKMTEQVEQRICVRFCVKLECSSMETIQMIQKAFRDTFRMQRYSTTKTATALGNW